MTTWITRIVATGGALIIVGFALVAAILALEGESAWLGDVPTWIASLIVVFAAAQFALDRDDRVSAHAVRLSCWLELDPTSSPRRYGFVLDNRSDTPFHDVTVDVEIRGVPQPSSHIFVVPPGRYFIERTPDTRFRWEFAVPYPAERGLGPVMNSAGYTVTRVTFRDDRGRLWRSTGGGRPTRLRVERAATGPTAPPASTAHG